MERNPGRIIQGKATADGREAGPAPDRVSVLSEPRTTAAAPVPEHRADWGGQAGRCL